MAGSPTRMLMIRHGQSTWNADGRWQGQADPPLSDLGRQQARRAAERVGSVDAVIASDLQRAVETAHIIAESIGVGPVAIEPRLRERDAGEWSGLTKQDIAEQYPGFLEERRRPETFETDAALADRLHAALRAVAAEYLGATVLIVAHGGLVYALEAEHDEPFERLPNLGGRHLEHDGERVVTLAERVLLVDDDMITTVPAQI